MFFEDLGFFCCHVLLEFGVLELVGVDGQEFLCLFRVFLVQQSPLRDNGLRILQQLELVALVFLPALEALLDPLLLLLGVEVGQESVRPSLVLAVNVVINPIFTVLEDVLYHPD